MVNNYTINHYSDLALLPAKLKEDRRCRTGQIER